MAPFQAAGTETMLEPARIALRCDIYLRQVKARRRQPPQERFLKFMLILVDVY